MKTLPAGAGPRYLFLAAVGLLAAWAVAAQAVDPERMNKADEPPAPAGKPAAKAEPVKPPEPTVAFEMRSMPWGKVLEWLSDQTNMPVIVDYKLADTFTFISPKGKKYTIPEIIDILNESLLKQDHLLIRRERNFILVPADKKLQPEWLPRSHAEELSQHGNTEVVQLVLPLKTLMAEDIAPEVKRMMGPFVEVSV